MNSLQWGGSDPKWEQLIPRCYAVGVIMGLADHTAGCSLFIEGCSIFPSFPLSKGVVSWYPWTPHGWIENLIVHNLSCTSNQISTRINLATCVFLGEISTSNGRRPSINSWFILQSIHMEGTMRWLKKNAESMRQKPHDVKDAQNRFDAHRELSKYALNIYDASVQTNRYATQNIHKLFNLII